MSKTKPTAPEFTYEVITQEDPETGDLLLPLPPELLREMGWVEGDTLDLDVDDLGRWVIQKKQ
jgi:hypothetical protein